MVPGRNAWQKWWLPAGRRIFSAWCQSDFAPEPSRDLKGPNCPLSPSFRSHFHLSPIVYAHSFPSIPSLPWISPVVALVGRLPLRPLALFKSLVPSDRHGRCPSPNWRLDFQWKRHDNGNGNHFPSKGHLAPILDENEKLTRVRHALCDRTWHSLPATAFGLLAAPGPLAHAWVVAGITTALGKPCGTRLGHRMTAPLGQT